MTHIRKIPFFPKLIFLRRLFGGFWKKNTIRIHKKKFQIQALFNKTNLFLQHFDPKNGNFHALFLANFPISGDK